ncbi:DUF2651 family protein [Microbacteriaceae bacterium 4G12]
MGNDTLTFIFIYFPLIIVVASITGTILLKNFYMMPVLVFLVFLVLTFTVFNSTFFVWVLMYTGLSLLVSIITWAVRKFFKKDSNVTL